MMFEIQSGLYQRYIDGSTAMILHQDCDTNATVQKYNDALQEFSSNDNENNFNNVYEAMWRLFTHSSYLI